MKFLMMSNPLTIQAFFEQTWHDIATLHFDFQQNTLQINYLEQHGYQYYLDDNYHAVSINYPVEFFSYHFSNHLVLFDDLIPSGASLRYWQTRLDLQNLSQLQKIHTLLAKATIAPIGNLRIKEAVRTDNNQVYFSLNDVKNRQHNFLEYANECGAITGGATGAGGDAPKLLLRLQDDEHIWIDNSQMANNTDLYYLVKYPRNNRTLMDCDILRAEYHFYHELHDLGFDTIATQNMRLIEGEHYPSLWLPRFDVVVDEQGVTKRYAMQSVYGILNKTAGSDLKHGQTIRCLLEIIKSSQVGQSFDQQNFVIEWVTRDLLNIVFGNSDNHGRNTAFLIDESHIQLAPTFDFAPMRADSQAITRTTKWQNDHVILEKGGNYHFVNICQSLEDIIDPQMLLHELQMTAEKLLDLPKRLKQRGVSDNILKHPNIGFDYLPTRLKDWGLIT